MLDRRRGTTDLAIGVAKDEPNKKSEMQECECAYLILKQDR